MKRILTAAALGLACSTAAHALEGTWKAEVSRSDADRIHVGLTYGRTRNMGTMYDRADFSGLTLDRVGASATTPVRYTLDREAGKVVFEGSFRDGRGKGTFTFAPDATYFDKVRGLGVETTGRHVFDPGAGRDERLLVLALLDVSTAYIRSMIAAGYREPLDGYIDMRIFGVTPEYVSEMRSAGFPNITREELVTTKIHGVTADFVRGMRAEGHDLSLDDLVGSRIHDVTPEFRDEMAKLGYRVSIEQLTAFRIHGVTPEWIAELEKLGYDRLSADELVSTRIFQVTPAFIRSLRQAGFKDLPMDELIDLRIHNVTAEALAARRAI